MLISSDNLGVCSGDSMQFEPCRNQGSCPFWATWGEWSACSTTCGEASRSRSRECIKDEEIVSSDNPGVCSGKNIQSGPCTTQGTCSTTTATTTITTALTQPQDWFSLLMTKIEAVFEENRPGKPRTHLVKKWKSLTEHFIQRYEALANSGCEFADTYENNNINIDFDTVDACKVNFEFFRVLANNLVIFFKDIDQVVSSFGDWGGWFTFDCNKIDRETDAKWFIRKMVKVHNVARVTKYRLKCLHHADNS